MLRLTRPDLGVRQPSSWLRPFVTPQRLPLAARRTRRKSAEQASARRTDQSRRVLAVLLHAEDVDDALFTMHTRRRCAPCLAKDLLQEGAVMLPIDAARH